MKFIKQLFCNHDWRIKGFGTMETPYFKSTEKRCCKCKKITFEHISKINHER